jgi:nucleoid DNA-binding protein
MNRVTMDQIAKAVAKRVGIAQPVGMQFMRELFKEMETVLQFGQDRLPVKNFGVFIVRDHKAIPNPEKLKPHQRDNPDIPEFTPPFKRVLFRAAFKFK